MGVIVTRNQPQGLVRVNNQSPLIAGKAKLLYVGSASTDVINGAALTNSGTSPIISNIGILRRVSTTNDSPNYLAWPVDSRYDLNGPFTIFIQVRSISGSGPSYDRIFSRGIGGNGGVTGDYGFLLTSSSVPYFTFVNGGGGNDIGPTGAALSNSFEILVATYDGATQTLYRNGSVAALRSVVTAFPGASTTSASPRIGCCPSSTTGGASVDLAMAGVIGFAWTASQVIDFTNNPLQILAPSQRRIWVGAIGSATSTGRLSYSVSQAVNRGSSY